MSPIELSKCRMPTLAQLLTILLVAVVTVLANPVNSGNTARFARRSGSIDARSALPETNAARLARGLTPSPPKSLFSPSRVRRNTPSAVPPTTFTGVIAIYQSSTLVGYLASSSNIMARSGATLFQYTTTTSTSTSIVMATDPTKYLSVGQPVSGTGSGNMGSSSDAYGRVVTTTTSTALNAPPAAAGDNKYETTIFSIDPTSSQVSIQWVNPSGERLLLTPFNYGGAYLFATGSVSRFHSAHSGVSADAVTMVFVPQ
ncbi:hypothetical protein OE88DRAFT_1653236 [Heliocybe sulcata]|uniref:Uncharacterized protein n=1 Tax=Heliocybe sulcata TaxID=5364 RepID=A0A5C3NAP5_9AGAM|nr:hypothetical protein OE88DRAFT_1653236 [Heliocybe sulcata]